MNLITKPYEQNFGFSSMSDEELFLINGGSMSGAIEILHNFGQGILDAANTIRDFICISGQALLDAGAGNSQNPDTDTKNPSHPANQKYYC